jgi:4-amino-4-deoxy-L-arabinose transferase-like glycosyltransferase
MKLRRFLEAAGSVVAAALVLCWARGRFGFYEDEGLNLLKAAAVAAGHPLYTEIYSDQAPLFTWAMAATMRIFGASVAVGGAVALVAGVLAWAGACAVARALGGRGAGLVCGAVLLALAPFLKFATTVVITTPALAAGLWSLHFALRARDGPTRLRSASGALLALACLLKLGTVYLLPVVVVAEGRFGAAPRGWMATTARWLAGFAVPIAVAALVCPVRVMIPQLTEPHVAALAYYGDQAAVMRRAMLLAPGMVVLYAAAAGAWLRLARTGRRHQALVLAVWVGVVLCWLLVHRPIWAHHLPDLLVPLAVCLAAGATAPGDPGPLRSGAPGAARLRDRWARAAVAAVSLAGLAIHLGTYRYWRRFYDNASEDALAGVAERVARASRPDEWVMSDRPMIAFLTRRRSPPELVAVMRKRILAGGLDDGALVGAFARYRPAALALCTDLLEPFSSFQALLARDYEVQATVRLRRAETGRSDGRCRVLVRRAAALDW